MKTTQKFIPLFDFHSFLEGQDFIDPDMIESALEYWFNDQKQFRSPFPEYIRQDLVEISVKRYMKWVDKLNADARKETNDEILVEHFEEVLFEEGMKMVKTDDERITIQYPFMIRCGDMVKHNEKPVSQVLSRTIIKKGDETFFKTLLRENESGLEWETLFELPN